MVTCWPTGGILQWSCLSDKARLAPLEGIVHNSLTHKGDEHGLEAGEVGRAPSSAESLDDVTPGSLLSR